MQSWCSWELGFSSSSFPAGGVDTKPWNIHTHTIPGGEELVALVRSLWPVLWVSLTPQHAEGHDSDQLLLCSTQLKWPSPGDGHV